MNKYIKLLLPLLCFQWATVNCDIIGENEYSNAHFKAQLDEGFKKYFNDNIYRIKENSRERRFFNRRQTTNTLKTANDNNVHISCSDIASVKSCSNGSKDNSFSCYKDISLDQFDTFVSCSTDMPNYGKLINAIAFNNINNQDYITNLSKVNGGSGVKLGVDDVIDDIIDKVKFVANKNYLPYNTTHFIDEMSNEELDEQENEKLISSDYYNCLRLVDAEIFPTKETSVCLCSYGYNKEIKGYSKDVKLNALYSYYGFSEQTFNDVCTPVLKDSEIFNNENKYISDNINDEKLLTLLEKYNIPNYGSVFNEMVVNSLKTSSTSLKHIIYDLYVEIGKVSRQEYNQNEESHEFGRCIVQAYNRVLDNSGLSYCLCNAGYNSFSQLTSIFKNYGLSEDSYDNLCSKVKEERNDDVYCRLGNSGK